MGDTVNSFLMGQAAADLLNSLKARFEDARNDAEIRSLMYQMRDAYERQVVALQKNIEIYRNDLALVTRSRNEMTESRKIAVKTAEKAILKIRELRATRDELIQKNSDIETQKAKLIEENNALKLQLKKSLAEAVVYSSVAYAAKTVLESSPELREKTRDQYTQHITACIKKSLEKIRSENGDEMFHFATAYINWASTNYLKDVGRAVQSTVSESLRLKNTQTPNSNIPKK